jgi:hypothetical protein
MHNSRMNELLAMKASIKKHDSAIHNWLQFQCTEKNYRNKIIFKYTSSIQSHIFLLMIWWRFTIIKVEPATTVVFLWLLVIANNCTPQVLNGWIIVCLLISQTFVIMMCYRTMLPRVGLKRDVEELRKN